MIRFRKVICIKQPNSFTKKLSVKVGDVYDAYPDTLVSNRAIYFLRDSGGVEIPCDANRGKKYFKFIEEFRDEKIEEILK